VTPPALPRRTRLSLALQRALAFAVSPASTLAVAVLLRAWLHLRVENRAEVRRAWREIWRTRQGPLLVCANHLTMIDSALIAWALAPPLWYVGHFSALPWNVPERTHFASTPTRRVLAYLYKCLPIVRGGSREELADTLARFAWLLSRGEVGLIFPEGGRSRSGRVEVENAAWGVGRIAKSVPGCRVLCVYLRGERQHGYSDLPARGDRLFVRVSMLEPKCDHGGLRGSREVAHQIAARLAEMEREHFARLPAPAAEPEQEARR
jgi:1-acyl-sn-glycerol-3-phosphate acyltransferase